MNSMLMQPFINYNLPDGWYLTSAPVLTADWKADKAGDVWTVPLGGGFGKLFRLGSILPLEGHPIAKLPINTQLAAYGNVARPEFGPKWQLRFQSRRAHRLNVELLKPGALSGEPIDIRRLDVGAVKTNVLPPQVVGDDTDNMWAWSGALFSRSDYSPERSC